MTVERWRGKSQRSVETECAQLFPLSRVFLFGCFSLCQCALNYTGILPHWLSNSDKLTFDLKEDSLLILFKKSDQSLLITKHSLIGSTFKQSTLNVPLYYCGYCGWGFSALSCTPIILSHQMHYKGTLFLDLVAYHYC